MENSVHSLPAQSKTYLNLWEVFLYTSLIHCCLSAPTVQLVSIHHADFFLLQLWKQASVLTACWSEGNDCSRRLGHFKRFFTYSHSEQWQNVFDPWGVKIKPSISGKEVNNVEIKRIVNCKFSSRDNILGKWHTMPGPFFHVLHEQKWFTVLIQIVQTGVSTCNSLIPKGVNYHRVIDRDWVFWGFFSIIAAIRFPLALSTLHIYMYSNLMSPLGFGYDPLLLLSP